MNRSFKKALFAVLAASMVATSGLVQVASALPSFATEKKKSEKKFNFFQKNHKKRAENYSIFRKNLL